MESEGMIPSKRTEAEIASLRETVLTGLSILKEAACKEDRKISPETTDDCEAALDGLEIVCEKARHGDAKAFSQLRSLAAKSLREAGSLGESGRRAKRPANAGRKGRAAARKQQAGLPDHPLVPRDLPDNLPPISDGEITSFLDARYAWLLARADYERRRAELIYKLRQGCKAEDQSRTANYLLSLDADGDTIHITDQTSVPAEAIIDRR